MSHARYKNLYFILTLLLFISCASVRNYIQPDGPFLFAEYALLNYEPSDTLKVVSFNIEHNRRIPHAIWELSSIESLKDADIILLQEVEDTGAERIARILHYNVLYAPTSVFEKRGRNFGNAILTRYSLTPLKKILVPHPDPHNKQKRAAISAEVLIGGRKVFCVSAHTMIYWPGNRGKRLDQIGTIASAIPSEASFVIAGGDFNTADRRSVEAAIELFQGQGMEWATQGIGITYPLWPLKLRLDHIFTRGFSSIASGKYADTRASDHYPVWAEIIFQE